MLPSLVALVAFTLGQVPQAAGDVPRARTIAPFVSPDVVAIAQIDLSADNIRALSALLAGERPPVFVAERVQGLTAWSERLRAAGAGEVYVVLSLEDLPGLPLVVVPIRGGADAAGIGRLLCGQGGPSSPVHFPACATIRDAVIAGTPGAIARIRDQKPEPRPELAAAFAAADGKTTGVRLIVAPTPEARRVLEELVPEWPRELGGGPIIDWTRGVAWVAAAVDGPPPSLRVTIASPSAEATRSLGRRGLALVRFLEKSPVERDIPRLISLIKVDAQDDRLRLTADADVAAGLIDSILQPVRESAARSTCVNNEKQIALAIHNYISTTRQKMLFPPAYTTGKDGKRLLSWRVLILPYLEQDALFKEFHLDEPWDSPHNRTLIAKMPAVYRCPLESTETARDGKTRYVAPRGAGTIFRGAEPVSLRDVTDGTSNTIMVLDAGDERAVIWTKPEDWDVPSGADEALKAIFTAHGNPTARGTNLGFADGAVRFLTDRIKPATLRALLTYAGDEVISPEDL